MVNSFHAPSGNDKKAGALMFRPRDPLPQKVVYRWNTVNYAEVCIFRQTGALAKHVRNNSKIICATHQAWSELYKRFEVKVTFEQDRHGSPRFINASNQLIIVVLSKDTQTTEICVIDRERGCPKLKGIYYRRKSTKGFLVPFHSIPHNLRSQFEHFSRRNQFGTECVGQASGILFAQICIPLSVQIRVQQSAEQDCQQSKERAKESTRGWRDGFNTQRPIGTENTRPKHPNGAAYNNRDYGSESYRAPSIANPSPHIFGPKHRCSPDGSYKFLHGCNYAVPAVCAQVNMAIA